MMLINLKIELIREKKLEQIFILSDMYMFKVLHGCVKTATFERGIIDPDEVVGQKVTAINYQCVNDGKNVGIIRIFF